VKARADCVMKARREVRGRFMVGKRLVLPKIAEECNVGFGAWWNYSTRFHLAEDPVNEARSPLLPHEFL
jgi:hypothetical protein